MNNEHVISDEVLDKVRVALLNDEHWMVYNKSLYFIEPDQVDFFKSEEEARDFCQNNCNDRDCFYTLHVQSVEDVIRKIDYGKTFDLNVTNPDANQLYNTDGNAFTEALIDHIEQQQILNNKNRFIMNEQNLQYLKDNIKYLGFGDKLYPELQKSLEQGLPEFQLKISTEFQKDKIGAELFFKKSETNDMYFLNRYDATLERSNGKELSQPFYLNKGNGVTIKEAYNLLHGRAVNKDLTNKDGIKYNAWIQLDLSRKNEKGNFDSKQFHENYGYNLEQSLSKFPVKELDNGEQKDALMKSLQKGNLQSVTFERDGKEQKMFVEANPQLKTINIYDSNMKLQQHDNLKKNESHERIIDKEQKKNSEEKIKDKSNDKKQELDQSNKKGKVVKMKAENSLLPKKRTSQKKGLSLS